MKRCRTCHEEKPLAAFRRNVRMPDGRLNHCAECMSAAERASRGLTPRKLDQLNARFLLAFGMRRCCGCKQAKPLAAFPRNRAQYLGIGTECRDCSAARDKARPLAERNERFRKWAAAHPEVVRSHGRKAASARRARIRNSFVEHVDPRVLWQRDEGVCGICAQPIEGGFDVDHIIPLVAGGEHSYANTRIAHPTCNRAKGREAALYADSVSHRLGGIVSQIDHGLLAAGA